MNRELTKIYPCLANLLRAYFNYDWIDDYPNWETVLADWLERFVEARKAMIEEISTILNKYDEAGLKEFFSIRQMDSGIQPPDYGYTYTDWLKDLRRRFQATL